MVERSRVIRSLRVRRIGWLAMPLVIGSLVVGSAMAGKVASSRGQVFARELFLIYRGHLPHVPREARRINLWIPLAKTWDGQTVLERFVHAPVPYTITQDPDYGNEILYLSLPPDRSLPLDLRIDYHVRLEGKHRRLAPVVAASLQRALQPDQLVIIDEEVRTRARRATAGRATLMGRARGIYEDVIRRMAYDKIVPGWGQGDTRRACLLGKGNCTDFHSLFISMARADSIPARFKIGWLIPEGMTGTLAGYHCWAEFYHPRQGWVPIDASEAWKHPERLEHYFGVTEADRVLLTVGRDIQLVPPQAGPRINIFFYPYLEVDGQTVQEVETQFVVQDHTAQEGMT